VWQHGDGQAIAWAAEEAALVPVSSCSVRRRPFSFMADATLTRKQTTPQHTQALGRIQRVQRPSPPTGAIVSSPLDLPRTGRRTRWSLPFLATPCFIRPPYLAQSRRFTATLPLPIARLYHCY
jgi:hypothetical protein